MTTPAKSTEVPTAADWKEELNGRVVDAREGLATTSDAVISFIKERPVLCLAGALAAGYLLGRIVRR